jgi:hypothetical protein
MTVETASLDIVTKERFESGLAEGVKCMDIIKIHSK